MLTDGLTDGRTEKRMPLSQSQKVREMFHARFDGCFVLKLIIILTLTKMSNFDITELLTDGQTDGRTDGQKSGRLCPKVRRSGRCFMQGLMVV